MQHDKQEGDLVEKVLYLFILALHMTKVKVKLSLCLTTKAPRHEEILGEWRYSSTHS
jgi:hypothetical protein